MAPRVSGYVQNGSENTRMIYVPRARAGRVARAAKRAARILFGERTGGESESGTDDW